MSKTLQQILGGQNLTGVIQAPTSGIPTVVPPEFLAPTRAVEGDYATYRKVQGTRKTARLAAYGAPSVQRALLGISEVPVKLIHTVESIVHHPTTLINLQQYDNPSIQQLGMQEVARQTAEFRQLFLNLRLGAFYSLLAQGAVNFDADGQLLPDSTGAAVSVDFQVPEANTGNLGGIISAGWSTAGTDIIGQVRDIKKQAVKQTGYPLAHAFYGANILDNMLGNNLLKELINRNSGFQVAAANGEVPQGLLGLTWHPIYEAFYNDADDEDTDFFGPDTVVFTPEPSAEWLEWLEGTYPVPTNIGALSADALSAVGNLTKVAGMFSYAQVLTDPVTIKHVAGDTFLPVLKVPGAIFIADVNP